MTYQPGSVSPRNHATLMDGAYRYQRHIYDLTRKYYLLGRDTLIKELDCPEGCHVLEVGCGTGRNLALASAMYPATMFYGVDISSEMLKSARERAGRSNAPRNMTFAQGDACQIDTRANFARVKFHKVFFSYSLSMIPDWEQALEHALDHLADGGSLHIVDFGTLHSWPSPAVRLMHNWLARFHVSPRGNLADKTYDMAHARGLESHFRHLGGGYSTIVKIYPKGVADGPGSPIKM